MHAFKDIVDRNSATSNESCSGLSIWRVVLILEVFTCC